MTERSPEPTRGGGPGASSGATVRDTLADRRSGLALQRTRMSADRTLMAVIRTALSLIAFGFTVFQFFHQLRNAGVLPGREHAPRNFGLALVLLGVLALAVGIINHVNFMLALRRTRRHLKAGGLIHDEGSFPLSFTLVVALCVLAIGVLSVASIVFGGGPFG